MCLEMQYDTDVLISDTFSPLIIFEACFILRQTAITSIKKRKLNLVGFCLVSDMRTALKIKLYFKV